MTAHAPEPGDVVSIMGTGAVVTIGKRISVTESGRAEILLGVTDGGERVAVKWYRPGPFADRERPILAAMVAAGNPHPALAWPTGIAQNHQVGGFGTVMALIPDRFESLVSVVSAPQQPSFLVIASLGRQLAGAFAALHRRGMRFGAFSVGQVLADPNRGEVFLALDTIGFEGEDRHISSAPRLMAPEWVRGQKGASAATDLHALAVVLFLMLMHGHPLEGKRTAEQYDGTDGDLHIFAQPLFIFDPSDQSNAPAPEDPVNGWWPIYPRFIRDLFTRAFTTGLASPGERVTGEEWNQAMARMADCESSCSCRALLLWDPDESEAQCWNCGLALVPPPKLREQPGRL